MREVKSPVKGTLPVWAFQGTRLVPFGPVSVTTMGASCGCGDDLKGRDDTTSTTADNATGTAAAANADKSAATAAAAAGPEGAKGAYPPTGLSSNVQKLPEWIQLG